MYQSITLTIDFDEGDESVGLFPCFHGEMIVDNGKPITIVGGTPQEVLAYATTWLYDDEVGRGRRPYDDPPPSSAAQFRAAMDADESEE